MIGIGLCWLVLAQQPSQGEAPARTAAPTRDESKKVLENHKKSTPKLPMPPEPGPDGGLLSKVNNGRFRTYYIPEELRETFGGGNRTPGNYAALAARPGDPAFTLDNTFKVKLFWISSRANDCIYCLGHQEHKLAVSGVTEDEIAALDGDWEKIPPPDRAAFQFTLKLTRKPHLVGPDDIADLKKHYTDHQIAEILQAVAGYNATNRWTDGLSIPAEENGFFFKRSDKKVELDTFLTPTSDAFKNQVSSVAPVKINAAKRDDLEPLDALEEKWRAIVNRKAVLPLAGDGSDPGWVRLLKVFPVANKGRISTLLAAETKGKLDERTKLLVAWSCARQDRAWYMLDLVKRRMETAGITAEELKRIDANDPSLPEKDRGVITLARKLTVAPWTITHAEVNALRKSYSDFQVAEIFLHGCNAAYLDRVTEVSRLPLDSTTKVTTP